MSEPTITDVTYRSGTHPTEQSWDVLQVIYQSADASGAKRIVNSFVAARAGDGTILCRTDAVLDRWEIITDEDKLRFFQSVFDDRDRSLLTQESAKAASIGEGTS